MSCAAHAARPRAGLRAFILSLPHPRRLARSIGGRHLQAGRALLLAYVLALPGLQVAVHAHALSHLPAHTLDTHDAVANGKSPGEEDGRHTDAVCLVCLALAAFDLPAVAPRAFVIDDGGALSLPVASFAAPSVCRPLQPRCRAPPASIFRYPHR